VGVFGFNANNGCGVKGYSKSCYGVIGYSLSCHSVGGNTAYFNYSSKYLKYNEEISISDCIRNNSLPVYKYYWEDSNSKSFNSAIGPMAEDFLTTFELGQPNQDEPEGIWSVDGVALGLGIENLNEIDKLKEIVTQLYSCIQKLEGV
jgi:hypothetical protein